MSAMASDCFAKLASTGLEKQLINLPKESQPTQATAPLFMVAAKEASMLPTKEASMLIFKVPRFGGRHF